MGKNLDLSFVLRRCSFHKGIALVWTAVTLTVMVGFAALTIDIGRIIITRTELQVAADASAMAGVSILTPPVMQGDPLIQQQLADRAHTQSMLYAGKNTVEGKLFQPSDYDVEIGNIAHPEMLNTNLSVNTVPYNAVRVRLEKSVEAPSGPIQMTFARIWGIDTASMSATATAYLDTRVSGYRAIEGRSGPAIPVSVRWDTFDNDVVKRLGTDEYGFDPVTGKVTQGPDGIPEVSIYPESQKMVSTTGEGAGNFGILNFDDNMSASTVGDEIRNGLTENNFISAFGCPMIDFYKQANTLSGVPITTASYTTGGTPGLMASLKDDFEARLGTVVGFFTHTTVADNGANCQYTINSIQFGRVMYVNMTGNPSKKTVVIQPVAYVGPEIITKVDVPPHMTAGRIKLIR